MPLAIDVANAQLTGRRTLFPVVSSGPAAPQYLCGPDAESLGVHGIREVRGLARVYLALGFKKQADQTIEQIRTLEATKKE